MASRLVHRGVVPAAGLVFLADLVPVPLARRRILRMRMPGDKVFQIPGGWLLLLDRPTMIDCASAPGLPVVRIAGLLCSAPVRQSELDESGATAGSLVMARAGALQAFAVAGGEPEDVSDWIDISGFAWSSLDISIGEAAAKPHVTPAPETDVRATLGLSPAVPEGAGLLAELERGAGRRSAAIGLLMLAAAGIGLLLSTATRLASLVGGLFPQYSERQSSAPTPSAWQRLGVTLNRLFAGLLMRSRLGALIGRRHAQYLAAMLEMFDRRNFDEALRYAIPLTSKVSATLRPLALRLPVARTSLGFGLAAPSPSSTILLGMDLFQLLRQRYRAAADQLEAAGEIDKAAFVLAELLQADEEAVSLLERHGKLRLAAELAEARKLSPGVVIRQWFLAKDWKRALRIARRTGKLADAVRRLESTHKEEADSLRIVWGDMLASSGAFRAAVEVVWPVTTARHLTAEWIERGISAGGPSSATLLLRRLALDPGAYASVLEASQQGLEAEGYEALAWKKAFAQELLMMKPCGESRALARLAAPALLPHDAEKGTRELVERLAKLAEHGALQADVLALPRAQRLTSKPVALEVRRGVNDSGAMPVWDAAMLPNGSMILALGEGGVRVVSRYGKVVFHLPEPCAHIVVSDHGDRAILLAPRGEAYRLARLDIAARRARTWCDARFTTFAEDFDGSTWFVANDRAVFAIDVLEDGWEALWHLDGLFPALARSGSFLSLLSASSLEADAQVWTYSLPAFRLMARKPIPNDLQGLRRGTVSPSGHLACWSGESEENSVARLLAYGPGEVRDLPTAPAAGHPVVSERWAAFAMSGENAMTVVASDLVSGLPHARIFLEGARHVGMRIQQENLVVCDDCGRVLVLSLNSRSMIMELEVT